MTFKMLGTKLQAICLLAFLLFVFPCYSLPLSTNNRWIVDATTGHRVKLACAAWPSHMETMLAEGLDKQPLSYLVSRLAEEHFNCVRFTYATYMFSRANYGKRTVAQSFDSLNMTEAKAGIAKHNPSILQMTVVQAHEAVVDELGAQGIMVVLDNHVSKPTWCCSDNDGNGFFGDTYVDPQEWLRGLITAAKRYKGKSQVIAISTRNEPHGPLANVNDWYRYIHQGAAAIHKENPDVLVFVSGLGYATDLTFLKERPFGTNLDDKLVYEAHWYAWSWGLGDDWEQQPLNKVCPNKTQYFINQTAFMNAGDNPVPIFLGEFGLNQQNVSVTHDYFLSCFLAYATDQDIDWSLWAFPGGYYIRQNKTGTEETFGVMDFTWNHIRNPKIEKRLQLIKRTNQDPMSQLPTSYAMFHPQSGSCMHANKRNEICAKYCDNNLSQWIHHGDGSPIWLAGTNLCLKLVGDKHGPVLSTDCSSQQSAWTRLSESKLHLAAKDENGEYLCLHKEYANSSKILTRKCICIEDDASCKKDPSIQWFKLVKTYV